MRLVESVRLNCCVKSAAQVSGNGCCCACNAGSRFGTGFRRGILPRSLLSAMITLVVRLRSAVSVGVSEKVEDGMQSILKLAQRTAQPATSRFPSFRMLPLSQALTVATVVGNAHSDIAAVV